MKRADSQPPPSPPPFILDYLTLNASITTAPGTLEVTVSAGYGS